MAAKNKFLNAMKMPSIDDMFSSEADRQRESGDLVTEVPLSELHPFVGHPFEVRDDEDMQKLVDSIRENGVLTNLTVRRRAEGGYEIISGHRRFHAAQRAGLDRVKVQVRDIDDDQAIIDMVDTNIQREHISPMEKASAYWAVQENINAMRAAAGLSPLTMNSGLSAAADARCESFVVGGPFDHSGMTTRSEICAAGLIGSASSVCTYWQGSPAHYANIMEPSFTSMGVGCWFCSTAEGQYTYWTVTFQ